MSKAVADLLRRRPVAVVDNTFAHMNNAAEAAPASTSKATPTIKPVLSLDWLIDGVGRVARLEGLNEAFHVR